MLEFSNKDFNAAFSKQLTNLLETKKQQPQQRNRSYREESNGNFRTKKIIIHDFFFLTNAFEWAQWRMEMTEERIGELEKEEKNYSI